VKFLVDNELPAALARFLASRRYLFSFRPAGRQVDAALGRKLEVVNAIGAGVIATANPG
jgi:hypothetical protein